MNSYRMLIPPYTTSTNSDTYYSGNPSGYSQIENINPLLRAAPREQQQSFQNVPLSNNVQLPIHPLLCPSRGQQQQQRLRRYHPYHSHMHPPPPHHHYPLHLNDGRRGMFWGNGWGEKHRRWWKFLEITANSAPLDGRPRSPAPSDSHMHPPPPPHHPLHFNDGRPRSPAPSDSQRSLLNDPNFIALLDFFKTP